MLGGGARHDVAAGVQKALSADQLEVFYHSGFVMDQVNDFQELVGQVPTDACGTGAAVLDIGGGVGFFAAALRECMGVSVRVADLDAVSVEKCRQRGIPAVQSDAISIVPLGDEAVVCFNLILHHLVGRNARTTRELQTKALERWRSEHVKVFVNEYLYESFVPGFSSALIYHVTSSKCLSAIARLVSRVVPSLHANTLGVGVRFRGQADWVAIFQEAGFKVERYLSGREERVDLPLRLLLIRSIKRSSFLLTPAR